MESSLQAPISREINWIMTDNFAPEFNICNKP
ncbi:hypothetical protein FOPG_06265 [Fusarium oxysporum f. sp. conglutinans race 2 54008]|uniref:Uncharacterized protein n=1 Tax=Fusarium oxysporum f. sp. conglutinans race 2 54008 TaxID=1089457 RepID=X0I7H5_FUSOX|nr:hypothetical protein FOPG_06265 [Fusarium oxysporum f. sp. conglutinans race 2 54008]